MPLDPFFESLVTKMAGQPGLSDGSPPETRERLAAGRAALGPAQPMHRARDLQIPTRGGRLTARILLPEGPLAGIILYVHGGGWVLGAIDDFDTLGRQLAALSHCAVVLPEYRLAPEHPFPAGLEDIEDVTLWLASGAGGLPQGLPLILAGDSAGGNLATVAARHLAKRVDIALQVLLYPVTDCDFTRPSYRQHGQGLPLTAKDMRWFFDHYAPADRHSDPAISPLRAADLAGLPPALILTAECDVLADEGRAYAAALEAAGVGVDFTEITGAVHGFARLHNHTPLARDALVRIAARIQALQGAARPA